MSKFRWLNDYRELECDIAALELNIERNKRELSRWTCGDLSKLKLLPDSNGSKLEERIAVAEYELAHKLNDLHDLRTLISTFDGLDYKILYRKHVEGKTLETIANELNYSTNYIKIKHANLMRMMRYAEKVSSK